MKNTLNIPDNFQAVLGEISLEAAASEGNKTREFTLVANTGKPMVLGGFAFPVIINMAGAKFEKSKTPIIADHDTTKRIGHTTLQKVIAAGAVEQVGKKTLKGPMIAAYGAVSSGSDYAKAFVNDSENGFPFQVSVGASIVRGSAYLVAEGESVSINGETFKGPVIVAGRTLIKELSVCVLGADSNTSANLAANFLKGRDMLLQAFAISLGLDFAAMSDEAKAKLQAHYDEVEGLKANKPIKPETKNDIANDLAATKKKWLDEESRLEAIKATAEEFSSVKKIMWGGKEVTLAAAKKAAMADDNACPKDFALACMKAAMPQSSNEGPAIHIINKDVNAQAVECSILRACGLPMSGTNAISHTKFGIDSMYSSEVLEASDKPQNRVASLSALFDMQIRAAGNFYTGNDRSSKDFFALAVQSHNKLEASGFSTLSITNILENAMNKAAFSGFTAVENVWPFICGRRPLKDFRPHNFYRLDYNGNFKKVAADGQLKHVSMTDSKKTLTADTYGAVITIDRKTIRNDDLGEVVQKALGIGTLAAQRIEESVFVTILANAGSFFSAGNANYLSGGSSVLSITSLDSAKQLFRNQTLNSKPINVSPKVLLVGTALEMTANRLFSEDRTMVGGSNTDTGQTFVNNPHAGLYKPYVSPYMNNTSILDENGGAISGQSATKWLLLGDPASPLGSAVTIGFLDNRETPYFDQAETEFTVPGGLQMRSYLDWGTGLHVNQLGVMSAGA